MKNNFPKGFKIAVQILFFIVVSLGLCGCNANKQRNVILFNHDPITKENLLQNSTMFDINKKIYYIFMCEKPIGTEFVRIRILKREEKANYALTKVAYSNDYRLYKDQVYYYNDYIVLHEAGYYCMIVYGRNKLDRPLATADFRVK